MAKEKTDDFLKELQKINGLADFLDDSEYAEIKDYISTGSLAVNAIVTGDIFKGAPSGRIMSLEGESGVGKSFISGMIAAGAQKKGYKVIWFDSENATDKFFLKRLGVDTKQVHYLPVVTIEEFRNQSYKILSFLEEKQKENPELRLIIVLDSLGNLSTEKEMADVEKGHNAQDMGQKAKIIKSMTRTLTGYLARTNTPMIIVNHGQWSRESNPMIPPKFVPTGGLGVIYLSSIRLFLSKRLLKENKEDKKELTGNVLKAKTQKNRLIPEGQFAEMEVNFETGINKYFGLLNYALEYGIFKEDKGKTYVPHLDKTFPETKLYTAEIWEPILNDLNEAIKAHNKFSSVSDDLLKSEDPEEEAFDNTAINSIIKEDSIVEEEAISDIKAEKKRKKLEEKERIKEEKKRLKEEKKKKKE